MRHYNSPNMKNIGIFSRILTNEQINELSSIFNLLTEYNFNIFLHHSIEKQLRKKIKIINFEGFINDYYDILKCDILICIGGDGAILESIKLVRDSQVPILGINTGRMGFLSSVNINEAHQALKQIISGFYLIINRSLLKITSIDLAPIPNPPFALNDITLSKKDTNNMITIHAYINNILLNSYWADGLIVSTPTGSTAYSLSCNGPILTPDSPNFIITPIAPHNLSVRPIVFPDNAKILLKTQSRETKINLTIDSTSYSIPSNSSITIEKENFTINTIQLPDSSFFSILKTKLLWGSDVRN